MTDGDFICPVLDRCIDHPEKCESCKRNTGKRSYYIPEYMPLNNYEGR